MGLQLTNTPNWSGAHAAGMDKTTIPPVEMGVDSGGLLDTVWRGFNAIGTPKIGNTGPNALGQPKTSATTVAPIVVTYIYLQATRMDILMTSVDPTVGVIVSACQAGSAATPSQAIFVQIGLMKPGSIGIDIGGAYDTQFGTPSVGARIFFSLTPVNQWGVTGPATVVTGLVNATSSITFNTLTSPSPGVVTSTFSGGGTFSCYVYIVDGSVYQGSMVKVLGPGVSPLSAGGFVSGSVVGARLSDGISFGTGSSGLTVT